MAKHSARGAAWDAQRKRVLDRDGWTCQRCAKPLAGADATVDHIEPIVLDPGREYRDDELQALCRRCNGVKSDRTAERTPWLNPAWIAGVVAQVAATFLGGPKAPRPQLAFSQTGQNICEVTA